MILLNKKWDKIQKEFEETFENETKNLKDQLVSALDIASQNIADYLAQCYHNLDKFYSQNLERKDLLYKNYISMSYFQHEYSFSRTVAVTPTGISKWRLRPFLATFITP